MTETDALIVLNAVPGLGTQRIQQLTAAFGSAVHVLEQNEKALVASGIVTLEVARKMCDFEQDTFLASEYRLMREHGVQVITYTDPGYPTLLKEIADPPVVLYVKGTMSPDDDLSIAVVGSRRASVYGCTMAEKFSLQLAELGISIVSGMARGIDTSAHQGCLRAQGRTLAVLGCGLSRVYPPENKELRDRIAANGAALSEFPMTMMPLAYNFPRRNRIISGLSLGVLVVEAAARSGALITSRCALEQGREVFAMPGKVDNPNAQGVHRLIQQGAKLVGSVEDILEELAPRLKGHVSKTAPPVTRMEIDLSAPERRIYALISANPVHVDDLAAKAAGSPAQVTPALLQLELKHRIKQLPGRFFVRV